MLEFTKLFTDIKIPSSFHQLIKSIGENKIEYTKTWYCQLQAVTRTQKPNKTQNPNPNPKTQKKTIKNPKKPKKFGFSKILKLFLNN